MMKVATCQHRTGQQKDRPEQVKAGVGEPARKWSHAERGGGTLGLVSWGTEDLQIVQAVRCEPRDRY
jgi:hypothetical protein